ncbi:peptide MFS transporter [Sphingobium sp. BYY-5]|uniref:peptide MFS transporter n=1 Tax=Sphingobium sp. BYY-5 TaxID=2926400 RepID=UPI001FA6AAEF|nr:peptide MFS transporter [Sphingobium sp. BYY-5]MCI4591978.1 peptide MFS transporter [Sphingobium sp. BYY-5]
MAITIPSHQPETLWGHPKGLYVLFFTELWERFSFYGMRALLIFYLTRHFLYSGKESGLLYGSYLALVFLSPMIGGYLADRWLGQRKAVLFGGMVIASGHILLGTEDFLGGSQATLGVFWIGLSLIVVGTGFLKANISALVGKLYAQHDPRRDSAYTLFYMGINIGGAVGPLMCGLLGETLGWSYGFGAAAIGMIAGIIVFARGKRHLLGGGEAPDPAALAQPVLGVKREWLIYGSTIPLTLLSWLLLVSPKLTGTLLAAGGLLVGLLLVWIALARLEGEERRKLLYALALVVIQPVFWGLYEQSGSSLNLFIDYHVNRMILGYEVPASVFQALPPLFVCLIALPFAALWLRLAKRNRMPTPLSSFGFGIIMVGGGFVLMAAAQLVPADQKVPLTFIFLLFLCHAVGEMCLSPVGLSAMSRFAPRHMTSFLMGTWFLATAAGNFSAGVIASVIEVMGGGANGGDRAIILDAYLRIGLVAAAIGAFVLTLNIGAQQYIRWRGAIPV